MSSLPLWFLLLVAARGVSSSSLPLLFWSPDLTIIHPSLHPLLDPKILIKDLLPWANVPCSGAVVKWQHFSWSELRVWRWAGQWARGQGLPAVRGRAGALDPPGLTPPPASFLTILIQLLCFFFSPVLWVFTFSCRQALFVPISFSSKKPKTSLLLK